MRRRRVDSTDSVPDEKQIPPPRRRIGVAGTGVVAPGFSRRVWAASCILRKGTDSSVPLAATTNVGFSRRGVLEKVPDAYDFDTRQGLKPRKIGALFRHE